MIRNGWMFKTAMAAVVATVAQGCASSASRMPPGGGAGYGAPAYAAPAPGYAPTPDYAPAPYPVQAAYPMATTPVAAAGMIPAPFPVAVDQPAPATGITGLTERQPDLCGAKSYAGNIGQPGSVIPSLGVTKNFRIVEYRGIEPQTYVPTRIVFRLDAAGTITKIDCG